jgi:hypothetical protein
LPVVISPLLIGKASTLVQILYIFAALLLLAFDVDAPRLIEVSGWACGLFTILTAVAYGGVFLRGLARGRRIA